MLIEQYEGARHSAGRSSFTCGDQEYDEYLQRHGGQQQKKTVITLWVATEPPSTDFVGYYTLSAHSIVVGLTIAQALSDMAAYPEVPAILLGRLAVASSRQGCGLSKLLVKDALIRCSQIARTAVGAQVVAVDPRTEELANRLYRPLGFEPVEEGAVRMYLPIRTIDKGLAGAASLR